MSIDNDLDEVLGVARQVEPEPPEPAPLEVVKPNTVLPLHAQWERFKPQFVEAMKLSPHSVDDLEKSIGQGRTMFFPGKNAAITAEKVFVGATAFFQVTWAIGDIEEILSLAPGIEAVGRLLGCSFMLIEGRRGWEKMLKPLDYNFWSITLQKAI